MGFHKDALCALPKEERYFSAIGRFVDEYSGLEAILKLVIARAIGLKRKHVDALMSHDFALTCNIAETVLAEFVAPEKSEEFKTLISDCRKLNEDRVRIVHGLWLITDKKGVLTHVARNSLKRSSYFQDPNVLAGQAEKAAVLRFNLARIFPRRVQTSPEQHREAVQRFIEGET
jgi:hypothetical protein